MIVHMDAHGGENPLGPCSDGRAGISGSSYFQQAGLGRFAASPLVGGGWDPAEQHVAPLLGLLAHEVERHRDERRSDGMLLARASYDIYGTLPIGDFGVDLEVVRPGRTIELVEARVVHSGRTAVALRAWLMRRSDTSAFAGADFDVIPGPEHLDPWDMAGVWPGEFVKSVAVKRREAEPGRAIAWVRSAPDLLEGVAVGPIPRLLGLVDIANGLTPRADPGLVMFPNLDLTAHLFREPKGEWFGFDTRVAFGADGRGVTQSTVHDRFGPVATVAQTLTVRARG